MLAARRVAHRPAAAARRWATAHNQEEDNPAPQMAMVEGRLAAVARQKMAALRWRWQTCGWAARSLVVACRVATVVAAAVETPIECKAQAPADVEAKNAKAWRVARATS